MNLVVQLVFKTSSGRIIPPVAGSIPALSEFNYYGKFKIFKEHPQCG